MSMASPISATFSPSLSNTITKPPRCSLSSPLSFSQTPKIQFSSRYSHLGLSISSPWSGSKHLGTSFSPKALNFGRNRSKSRLICASLFGVGAPEALVIGVVALLVFGPKGLAEVARNLGKTLRAFQPTIRELQDVSREFKSTLEREIGLDDISSPTQNYSSYRPPPPPAPSPFPTTEDAANVADPNGAPSSNRAYTTEEYLKLTEEQIKAVTSKQQEQTPSPVENPIESQPQPQVTTEETPAANPSQKPENETRNPVKQLDRSI